MYPLREITAHVVYYLRDSLNRAWTSRILVRDVGKNIAAGRCPIPPGFTASLTSLLVSSMGLSRLDQRRKMIVLPGIIPAPTYLSSLLPCSRDRITHVAHVSDLSPRFLIQLPPPSFPDRFSRFSRIFSLGGLYTSSTRFPIDISRRH